VLKDLDSAVYGMTLNGNSVFAASSQGLLVSADSGMSWKSVEGLGAEEFYFLGSARSEVAAAGLKTIRLSKDGGKTWKSVAAPGTISQLTAVALDGQGGLWAGGQEGVFLSMDDGASWQSLPGLFVNDVNSIFYDARADRVLITSSTGANGFAVHLPDRKISFWDTGWKLRFLRPVGDYLVGVTPFDGVVVQPRMVDSAEASHP
jgi:ligand-binding sensor domain-containing protein